MHPFIPFVTEELWSLAKFDKFFKTPLISYTSKNSFVLSKNQIKNAKNINVVINFITEIRSIKVTLGISPGSFCNVFLNNTSKNFQILIKENLEIIKRMGRIKEIDFTSSSKISVINMIIADENVRIQFENTVNLNDQKEIQLKKQKEILNKISISENKLNNPGFVQNAPKNVVDNEKEMLSNYQIDLNKIINILRSFS